MALKLYMVLLGGKPKGRHTEQHDMFFGIAESLKELIPQFNQFWPEAKGKMHIDGFREVNQVDGQQINIVPRGSQTTAASRQLFFINLGGYKKDEFDEFHYKMVVAAKDKAAAIQQAKQTAFFKHTHFEGANSHVDDKYGIDVDDLYTIDEVLPKLTKEQYSIELTPIQEAIQDELHLGYFKFDTL
ncbi:MAG: hypothetical protein RLY89_2325 [Bacteroidota bacterium]|jgi:hypothetical protein